MEPFKLLFNGAPIGVATSLEITTPDTFGPVNFGSSRVHATFECTVDCFGDVADAFDRREPEFEVRWRGDVYRGPLRELQTPSQNEIAFSIAVDLPRWREPLTYANAYSLDMHHYRDWADWKRFLRKRVNAALDAEPPRLP